MGDSKAPGRSLSESTGLPPHAASVKIDRPIFALASGLKQLAKASCGLSWLPHALLSSPNLGKAKVRPPSPCRPSYSTVPFKNCASVRPIFALASGLKQLAKASCGLSWLPHALLSSPNLGKAKVRPPSPCRPSYSTVPFKICSV